MNWWYCFYTSVDQVYRNRVYLVFKTYNSKYKLHGFIHHLISRHRIICIVWIYQRAIFKITQYDWPYVGGYFIYHRIICDKFGE